MRRLYFLIPTVELTETIVNELEQQGIPHKHQHVVAAVTHSLKSLPEASVWQKTELAHGLEWGTGIGGTAGLLGGLLTVAFPPGGIVLGGGALLIGAAAGAGVSAVGRPMKSRWSASNSARNVSSAKSRIASASSFSSTSNRVSGT